MDGRTGGESGGGSTAGLSRALDECEYRGRRQDGRAVIEFQGAAGDRWHRLPHKVRHSPTGMEWGYAGSGPADLARSLTAHVLGGVPAPVVYQGIKARLIQNLTGNTWTMMGWVIREAIEAVLTRDGSRCPFCLDTGIWAGADGRGRPGVCRCQPKEGTRAGQ